MAELDNNNGTCKILLCTLLILLTICTISYLFYTRCSCNGLGSNILAPVRINQNPKPGDYIYDDMIKEVGTYISSNLDVGEKYKGNVYMRNKYEGPNLYKRTSY